MKNRKIATILLFVCILTVFAGCKRERVPDNIMDTATFARFLAEGHLIESYDYTVVASNKDSLGYQSASAYKLLLDKYNVTQADYDSTLAYYLRHPKILEEIYARTVEQLKSAYDSLPKNETDTDSTMRKAGKIPLPRITNK